MPDLVDTGDPVDFFGIEDSEKVPIDQDNGDPAPAATPLIDDLFGDGLGANEQKLDEDPFAGMNVGEDVINTGKNGGPDFFDFFGSTSDVAPQKQENNVNDINNTMAGLSLGNDLDKQKGTSTVEFLETIFSNTISNLQGGLDSRTAAIGTNAMFPLGQIPYPAQLGVAFNQVYPSQPINYAAMGTFLAQQQFLAAMSNFQQLGGLSGQNAPMSYTSGTGGGFSSPLPDVFHANMPIQASTTMLNNSKEETKAFDFISDHLAVARDPKRK